MTSTAGADSQLATVIELRAEIEGIDRAARNPARAAEQDNTLSYTAYSIGWPANLSPISGARQHVDQIVASISVILSRLAPVATVETSINGFTARTVIHYTGRAASVWSGVGTDSSAQASQLSAMHLDALKKTYTLRVAFVGAIAAVASALASISLAAANPLTVLNAWASARALKHALERLVAAVEATVAEATL